VGRLDLFEKWPGSKYADHARGNRELQRELRDIFRTKSCAEWIRSATSRTSRSRPCNTPKTIVDDPQFQDRFPWYSHEKHGADMLPFPVKFRGEELPEPGMAPTVGEHTDAVCRTCSATTPQGRRTAQRRSVRKEVGRESEAIPPSLPSSRIPSSVARHGRNPAHAQRHARRAGRPDPRAPVPDPLPRRRARRPPRPCRCAAPVADAARVPDRLPPAHGPRSTHHLLDLGCGTLRGGLPLIAYLSAGNYTGIDVRAEIIEEALRELEEAGLEQRYPRIGHVESLAGLDLRASYDFIWAFGVLMHLEDADLEIALSFAARHLGERGTFYANVHLGDGRLGAWAGFPVIARPLDWYCTRASEAGLEAESLGRLSSLGHVSGDRNCDSQFMLRIRKER
jgi:SAM-dependent methyltransferase